MNRWLSEGMLALEREDRLEAFRRLSLRSNAVLTRASIIKAGEALDASEVVYGHYDLAPAGPGSGGGSRGVLRIGARILNLKRLRQGPELEESGAVEDLAALEARLSWQVLKTLSPKNGARRGRVSPRPATRAAGCAWRATFAGCSPPTRSSSTGSSRRRRASMRRIRSLASNWASRIGARRITAWPPGGWDASIQAIRTIWRRSSFWASANYQIGDYQAAAKCFETVAATVPLNEVYNDLGAAQTRANLTAAIESFRKALEGDSADPDYRFNLGYALWKAGQFPAAAESFRAALERNPNDDEAAALLGHAERRESAASRQSKDRSG